MAEFDQLPRSGDTVYGFAVGVYPTDHLGRPEGFESRYEIESVTSPSGVTHLTFTRR